MVVEMIGLLLLFIPLVAALLVLIGPKRFSSAFAFVLSLVSLGITGWAYCRFVQSGAEQFIVDCVWVNRPNIHFRLTMDGIALLMIALTNLVMPLILLSGHSRNHQRPRTFNFLLLIAQFALNGVFLADDAVLYYVFWELTLIPAYFLLMFWGGENRAKVTFKFFVYTLMGSLFMMIAFIYLYTKGGGLALSSGNLSHLALSADEQKWIFAAFFLAFAIKLPIIPFHTWQADTYQTAPTQAAMVLSGLMAKMGLFSIVRWMMPAVPLAFAAHQPMVMVICVVGVVYGAVIAIQQTDIKRMIAYASLSHVALMVAGIFSGTSSGLQAAFVQAFAHGINTVGIFFIADILQNRLGTTELSRMGGIRQSAPLFATTFFVIMFAMVALPFTNSFVGEVVLLFGVFKFSVWMAVIAALSLVLGAVYMMRMVRLAILGEGSGGSFKDLMRCEKVVLIPIVLMIFVFGLCYQPLFDLISPAVDALLNKPEII